MLGDEGVERDKPAQSPALLSPNVVAPNAELNRAPSILNMHGNPGVEAPILGLGGVKDLQPPLIVTCTPGVATNVLVDHVRGVDD